MPTGAITEYVNVAQVTLYVFWLFFFALIFYLHRENKREGYPLESDRSPYVTVQGFPRIPAAKQYRLPHGGVTDTADGRPDRRPVQAEPVAKWPGAPLEPTGNPMLDGVGPAAWAERADEPDLTFEGHLKIVPLRAAPDYGLSANDPNPIGLPVVGVDGEIAGTVRDAWVDRSERLIRYLEVAVNTADGVRNVLVPNMLVKVRRARRAPAGGTLAERLEDGRPREVQVNSVRAEHFAQAPVTKNPDQVTLLEEDRIMAYFGSGHFYALPSRREPLV